MEMVVATVILRLSLYTWSWIHRETSIYFSGLEKCFLGVTKSTITPELILPSGCTDDWKIRDCNVQLTHFREYEIYNNFAYCLVFRKSHYKFLKYLTQFSLFLRWSNSHLKYARCWTPHVSAVACQPTQLTRTTSKLLLDTNVSVSSSRFTAASSAQILQLWAIPSHAPAVARPPRPALPQPSRQRRRPPPAQPAALAGRWRLSREAGGAAARSYGSGGWARPAGPARTDRWGLKPLPECGRFLSSRPVPSRPLRRSRSQTQLFTGCSTVCPEPRRWGPPPCAVAQPPPASAGPQRGPCGTRPGPNPGPTSGGAGRERPLCPARLRKREGVAGTRKREC